MDERTIGYRFADQFEFLPRIIEHYNKRVVSLRGRNQERVPLIGDRTARHLHDHNRPHAQKQQRQHSQTPFGDRWNRRPKACVIPQHFAVIERDVVTGDEVYEATVEHYAIIANGTCAYLRLSRVERSPGSLVCEGT